ncbi:MAG: 30S ribosomal protein S17e [Candidatus Pacearchaeota archaeon]
MGRIKSKAIKRTALELLEKEGNLFSEEFEKNKNLLKGLFPSKKIRNKIAGYLVRLKKYENKERLSLKQI